MSVHPIRNLPTKNLRIMAKPRPHRPPIRRRRTRHPRRPGPPRWPLPDLMSFNPMLTRHVMSVALVVRRHAAVRIARRARLNGVVKEGVDTLAEVLGFALRGC